MRGSNWEDELEQLTREDWTEKGSDNRPSEILLPSPLLQSLPTPAKQETGNPPLESARDMTPIFENFS